MKVKSKGKVWEFMLMCLMSKVNKFLMAIKENWLLELRFQQCQLNFGMIRMIKNIKKHISINIKILGIIVILLNTLNEMVLLCMDVQTQHLNLEELELGRLKFIARLKILNSSLKEWLLVRSGKMMNELYFLLPRRMILN